MSHIKGKDTGPEMILRRALWARGKRYRLYYNLPGKPDIVFPSKRLAVFVDGCFWHGCKIHGTKPKSNALFWERKIKTNIDRDIMVNSKLKNIGWRILRFWEHDIKENIESVVSKVEAELKAQKK